MDMLGHSGGTLYKCRFTWLEDYEAVQFDKGFSERGYRGTLFRKKDQNELSYSYQNERAGRHYFLRSRAPSM
jgi:hypothetical protein